MAKHRQSVTMEDNLSHKVLFLGIIYLVHGNNFYNAVSLYDGIHYDFTCYLVLKENFSSKELS